MQREVNYQVLLEDADQNVIDTNTSVLMELHQREQVDLDVSHRAVILHETLPMIDNQQLIFTFTLKNINFGA